MLIILGQEAAQPSFEIIDWLTRIGVTGVIAYMWWSEKREREASQQRERESHARESALLERMIPVLTEATAALESVQLSQTKVAENLTGEIPIARVSQMQSLVEAMDALTEQLQSQRRPRGG